MNKTSIEWTDFSSNLIKYRDPEGRTVHGCVKVSAGCANCYASAISKRFSGGEFTAKRQATLTPFFDEAEAQRILRSRVTGKRIFIGDMTDVFGEWVPDELLDRMFAVFALRPDLTFQVLTKRPSRARAYLTDMEAHYMGNVDGEYMERWGSAAVELTGDPCSAGGPIEDCGFPLPNVWLGTSVENQAAAEKRIPELLATPAAVRFLSCEPLLGPVMLRAACFRDHKGRLAMTEDDEQRPLLPGDFDGLRWVIVGGESGPGARPCDLAWIRGIVGQCKAAGTAVFVKHVGAWGPCPKLPSGVGCFVRAGDVVLAPDGKAWPVRADLTCEGEGMGAAYRKGVYRDRKGGDPDEWPEDLRVREYPR